jgi:hypothetical protein
MHVINSVRIEAWYGASLVDHEAGETSTSAARRNMRRLVTKLVDAEEGAKGSTKLPRT